MLHSRVRPLLLALMFVTALAVAPQQRTVYAIGNTYYVNPVGCDNSGSGITTPWCDFSAVNIRTFSPGDFILLARGATWNQELQLHGSGTLAAPITVDAYGSGAAPRIIRNGKESDRGVRLENVSYWTVRNLEISNAGVGILGRVTNTLQQYRGWTFDSIYVHDIYGIYHKTGSGETDKVFNSAGIAITTPVAHPAGTPALLSDVVLTNIHGTHNQDSILFEGATNPDSIQGVTLSNLYLHDDDAQQPNNAFNTKVWEFNTAGNLEGWYSPVGMTATVSGGFLATSSTTNQSYIHSPTGLNINPNDYRYLRISLENNTSGTDAYIYFRRASDTYFQPGNYVRVLPQINPSSGNTEYIVDMATNPNWAPTTWQGAIDQLRLDFRSVGTVNVDYIRVARRGCDDSLRLTVARYVTVIDSRLEREAACNSVTGTAAVFLGIVSDVTFVNTIVKDTPFFAGNNDMDGFDFENRTNGVSLLNSYIAGNAGPGVNILTQPGGSDYSTNHEISGNLFVGNGTGYSPAVGSLREARGSTTAPIATGVIKTNIYRENGGLLTPPPPSGFTGFTIPSTAPQFNLAVSSGYYAADGFSSTQGAGGWSYQRNVGGSFSNLSYDAATDSWRVSGAATPVITRFAQQPELTAGAQAARAWTVPSTVVNRPISIRSRALIARPIDPSKQSVTLSITRTRGATVTQVWSGTLSSSNWTAGLEQISETDVTAGDVLRFIVTNTSANPAAAPLVSWTPAIGIR
jgi:hypothetical protein